ncbi:MAG: PASTA domain-containing protein [Prevotellaceae bacterium]|jgi:cell division protein FtsI (penicillin-binding protein 3)|nr:PASTA domain-containing protein [Prevotellaceae bacterium]
MTKVKNIVRRITLFYLLTVLLSLLIISQIIYLQFFTEFKEKAETIKTETIAASRGSIFSHDMQLLSVSIPKYEIRVDFHTMKQNFIENKTVKMASYYKRIKLTPSKRKNRTREQRKADTINANNAINELATSLSQLFKDKNAKEYEAFLKSRLENSAKYRYEKIGKKDIDFIELQELQEFPIFNIKNKNKTGLIINDKTKRIPVYDFAHATIGRVNSNDYASDGIEKSFDEYLRGEDGSRVFINGIPKISENVLPEAGCDIVTTLDVNMQETTEKALRQQIQKGNDNGIQIEGGTAIVMETATGEIRAIANMTRNNNESYDETYNYALKERSAPGSTFKLASLIALLDDGFADLNTMVDVKADTRMETGNMVWEYKGHKIRDGHRSGNISLKKVFTESSNIGTAKLITKHYEKNPQKYFDKLHSMGLFQESLKLQIQGENPSTATEPKDTIWKPQLLALSSYGYELELAPIHTLTFYNAVANNGKMMKPKFVKKIIKHGQDIKVFPDEIIEDAICSKETLLKVREALKGVVDSGTAKQFKDLRFDFAGKTGTAQRVYNGKYRHNIGGKIYHKYQATFAGYIPSQKPKYTIVVVMYSPLTAGNFYGATYAAPVFKEIAEKLYSTDTNWYEPVERNDDSLRLPNAKNTVAQQIKTITSKLDIPIKNNAKNNDWIAISKNNSELTTEKIQIDDNKVPSVINMGLRDAVYLLEKLGLKVSFSGKGKIQNQSIAAGTTIVKGATIYLKLEI